jgi:hypothetical protein
MLAEYCNTTNPYPGDVTTYTYTDNTPASAGDGRERKPVDVVEGVEGDEPVPVPTAAPPPAPSVLGAASQWQICPAMYVPMDKVRCSLYCYQEEKECMGHERTSKFMDPECLCFQAGTECGGCSVVPTPPTPPPPPSPPALAAVRELASLTSPWYFGAVPASNSSDYAIGYCAGGGHG